MVARKANKPDVYIAATVRSAEATSAKKTINVEATEALNRFANYVYIAIERKASAICACAPMVYRKAKKGGKRKVHPKSLVFGAKSAMDAEMAGEIEPVPDHPLLDLLARPNPQMSGSELDHLDATYLEATGNAYYYVITDGSGTPTELWPLQPQATIVVPSKSGLVVGYRYGRDAASMIDMTVDEVSHVRLPNPFNPYYGFAPIRACFPAADIYNAGDQHELALIDNQARPDYAWKFKRPMDEAVTKNLEAKLNARHRGVEKRGKHVIVSGEVEITPLQWSPKELQWIEQQKWSRDTIAACFSVPVSLLTVEDVNRANADAGSTQFLRYAIVPRLTIRAERLTNDLLPMYGDDPADTWVAFENPIPEDKAALQAKTVAYVGAGVWTINEARATDGKDPIEGGDALRVNGQPVASSYAEIVAGQQPAQAAPTEDAPADNAPTDAPVADITFNGAQVTAALDVLLAVGKGEIAPATAIIMLVQFFHIDEALAKQMVDAQGTIEPAAIDPQPAPTAPIAPDAPQAKSYKLSQLWSGGNHTCCKGDAPASDEYVDGSLPPKYEIDPPAKFVKQLTAYLNDQRDSILARMDEAPTAHKSFAEKGLDDAILSWNVASSAWDVKLLSTVRMTLDNISMAGAEAGLKELTDMLGDKPAPPDIAFDIEDDHFVAAFDKEADRFIRSVNDTTEKQIRSALQAGVQSGETIDQLKDRVLSVYATTPERATMIARTETGRFNTLGRMDQWRQSGIPGKKRWLLAGGACELCRSIAARGDVGYSDSFWQLGSTIIGDEGNIYTNDYAPVYGNPAHPNDRCTITVAVDPKYEGGEQ